MTKVFYPLFHIALQHEFYVDGNGRNLVLEPLSDTLRAMHQYGLQWRSAGNGCFLAYGQDAAQPALLAWLEKPLGLRFLLSSTNPYFFNITAIPFLRMPDELLYFSNLETENSDLPTSLSRTEKVGSADVLPVRGGVFEYTPPGGQILALHDAQNRVLLAADESGNALPGPVPLVCWKTLGDPAQPNTFRVNLSTLPSGKYGFDMGQEPTQWFYYAGEQLPAGTLGVVEIFIGKTEAAMVRPPARDQEGAAPQRRFQLSFAARPTHWRYYVINRSPVVYETMKVTDPPKVGDQPIAFTSGDAETLRSGGQTAIPVAADTALPLRERFATKPKLQLVKQQKSANGNGALSSIDLPTPDGQRISPEGQGAEQKVYSDMYVYL